MAEFYSKVTRRPRSKLERIVRLLEPEYSLPQRPDSTLIAQLVLYYLLWAEAPAADAASRVKSVRTASGRIDPKQLCEVDDTFVSVCASKEKRPEVIAALKRVAKVAEGLIDEGRGLGIDDLRRRLIAMPRLPAEQTDFILLACGAASTIAPSLASLRVAARLGYPGSGYAALARALDAELPERDVQELAWRAHHVLRLHAARTCAESAPQCGKCAAKPACSFAGLGEDPALRLV